VCVSEANTYCPVCGVPTATPTATPTASPTATPTATPRPVDHYKVYGLQPEVVSILDVLLDDQFGTGLVDLTNLGKLGAPVSKEIAPSPPSGVLLRPDEHLSWYEFFEAQTPRFIRVKNQFESENKGAIWDVGDGRFLLVPAIRDGLGAIQLGQHWKCYDAIALFDPDVTVNLLDPFHLEQNVVVGPGRYLCNPVEKNNEGPPSFPDEHLACYDIVDLPLGEFHSLDDQFGNHPSLLVENPELLCVPSLKYLPEPSSWLILVSGAGLLGVFYRRGVNHRAAHLLISKAQSARSPHDSGRFISW
jgi:hypothetical protein